MLPGGFSPDGRVKPVKGALPIAAGLRDKKGLTGLILARKNAPEAAAVSKDQCVLAADTLPQVIEYLNGEQALDRVAVDAQAEFGRSRSYDMDLSEIRVLG